MSVKMFTMTHKKFDEPKDTMYIPLHVGRALSFDLGYLADNTGDNISKRNASFSELTGVYWVWKNETSADYVGICHYRRYLINKSGKIFSETELKDILQQYDLITSKRLHYDYTYYEGYKDAHNINDLIKTGEVIQELYPEYYEYFNRLVHAKESYFGNIMVASKPLFDAYAKWLFTILLEVEKRIDISSYDDYHKRVFGFISEFLLLVWVEANQLKAYECMVGMSAEKTETKEMKEKLAVFFKEKDIEGAKQYFMECYEKRPDVLLEASDTTGELKLSMQVISTCENERMCQLRTALDYVNDFATLMNYFRNLNDIIKRYKKKQPLKTDIIYLCNRKVTYIAISIAVMLFCDTNELAIDTLLQISDDMMNQGKEDIALQLLKRCSYYNEDEPRVIARMEKFSV